MAQKPKYRVDTHFFPGSTDSERKSFDEGVQEGKSHPYTHAFFAGVGYGKKYYGHLLGFKNEEQRNAFERGIRAHDEHFIALEVDDPDSQKGPGFFLKLKAFFCKLKDFLFAKRSEKHKSAKSSESRKMKVKGKEKTLKRNSGKSYRITGGANVNKKKNTKSSELRKMKVKGKEKTLKRNSGKSYRITGGTHVNKKKSAKRMTAKRRK